jgi:hypothetical protein
MLLPLLSTSIKRQLLLMLLDLLLLLLLNPITCREIKRAVCSVSHLLLTRN